MAGLITVFIRTNPHSDQDPYYQRAASLPLTQATQDTRQIVSIAKRLLQQIFKAGYRYQQCGVQLSDIRPESIPGQIDLFALTEQSQQDNSTALMKTIDQINRRFHKNGISLAATGLDQRWQVKIENVSSRYTTDWDELVRVKCG